MEGRGVYYSEPLKSEIRTWTIPPLSDDEVLLKVAYCGICGSDHHIVHGGFGELAGFPLVPGHEIVGYVLKKGKNVQDFSEGDRCVVDPITRCHKCFFCRRGQYVQCINTRGLGVNTQGGFANHVVVQSNKLHKIFNISDEEATLIEPLSCAVHTVDKIAPTVGSDALVLGSGPSGVMISQLLKLNGASRVVLASNKGIKMDVAKQVNAADEYLELDRQNPEEQWKKFKEDNPFGFDVVVEASGSAKLLADSIHLVRPGGTLALYAIYGDVQVQWPATLIFMNEIRIIGTVGQANTFPRAVAYMDSGKINVKGMISRIYTHSEFESALEALNDKQFMKVAVKPDTVAQ